MQSKIELDNWMPSTIFYYTVSILILHLPFFAVLTYIQGSSKCIVVRITSDNDSDRANGPKEHLSLWPYTGLGRREENWGWMVPK